MPVRVSSTVLPLALDCIEIKTAIVRRNVELNTTCAWYFLFCLITWCDHVLLLFNKYRIEMLTEFTVIS